MSEQTAPPEAPPEAPPVEPPAAPESEPTETPEPEPPAEDLAGREAKARREAHKLRETLKAERAGHEDAIAKATGPLNQRISELEADVAERDAQLAGVGKFRNPRDVSRYIDVSAIKSPQDLDTEIARVLKEHPYLAVPEGAGVPQGAQNNGREQVANDASAWLRDQIMRR